MEIESVEEILEESFVQEFKYSLTERMSEVIEQVAYNLKTEHEEELIKYQDEIDEDEEQIMGLLDKLEAIEQEKNRQELIKIFESC